MAEVLEYEIFVNGHGEGFSSTAREIKAMRGETTSATKEFGKLEDGSFSLERAMEDAGKEAKRLRAEFAKTGNAGLSKEITRAESSLRRFERIAKQVKKDAEVGGIDFNNFGGFDFSGLAAESRGFAIAGAAGLAVAMAPLISTVVSSALVGAVGAGGVVGGAFLASRDYRVQAAWKQLGTGIMDELKPASDAFVQPMINAADILKRDFSGGGFVQTLEKASKLTEPLARGLGGFIEHLGPGLSAGVEAAGPTIKVLEHDLPKLADGISYLFHNIAETSTEASVGMHDFINVTDDVVRNTGDVIKGLNATYVATRGLDQSLTDIVSHFAGRKVSFFGDIIPINEFSAINHGIEAFKTAANGVPHVLSAIPPTAEALAKALDHVDVSLEGPTAKLGLFGEALDKAYVASHHYIDAEVNVEQALADLKQSFIDNGTTLNVHEQEGRNNIKMLETYASKVKDAFDADVEHTHSVSDANALWEHYRGALVDVATQAGYTTDQIDTLVKTFLGLPPQVTIEVNVDGASGAIETGRELARLYDRNYNTGINVNDSGEHGGGKIQAYADGGMVPGSGPQLAIVHGGEMVLSPQQQAAWPSGPGGGGGGTTVISFAATGNSLIDALIREVSKYIRVNGGNVQTVLGS